MLVVSVNAPSRLNAALLMLSAPPLLTVNVLRMRKGVLVPPWTSNSVYVDLPGALRHRLRRVSELGKPLAVVASLVTVFVPAFVIEMRDWALEGATFSNQFVPVSHLPLALLVQLFGPPGAATTRA